METIKGLGCVGLVLIGFVLLLLIPVGVWGVRVFFADEIGRGNAEIQLKSAPSRITRYEQFFNLCESVQNAEAALDAEHNRLKNTTDPRERETIQVNISALEATRAQGINQYNSNAAQGYTDAQFQASNLPYRLSTEPYVVGGEKTQCAA